MILILSKQAETTTDMVIDWIHSYGGEVIRINSEDLLFNKHCGFSISNDFDGSNQQDLQAWKIETFAGNSGQSLTRPNVIWYRRWEFSSDNNKINYDSLNDQVIKTAVNTHLIEEKVVFDNLWMDALDDVKWVDHPHQTRLDKLRVLTLARNSNLKIPHSIVTNRKNDLVNFTRSRVNGVILKSLSEGITIQSDGQFSLAYTHLLNDEDIANLPESFFPSLVQEHIPKQADIRTFYLDGVCYSMAIMSQNDPQTRIDFRQYNESKPNRNIPYQLPENIENRLSHLMRKLKLKTASIDFIKSTNGHYIFLEVNPTGQFGMTSYPCNYQLEKRMAEFLIRVDNENTC